MSMKKNLLCVFAALTMLTACGTKQENTSDTVNYNFYNVEHFADLQILRYKVTDFEKLSLQQKKLVYYLTEAALYGRDIFYDQNGKYNLAISRTLEAIYTDWQGNRESADFKALELYLKRVWFSSGIHHHYGSEKFVPGFAETFFREAVKSLDASKLPLKDGQTVDALLDEICPVMFDPSIMKMRTNQADGEDLILTSAANFYEGVTQQEAEDFYNQMKDPKDEAPISYGLNSKLVKRDGKIVEDIYKVGGLYSPAIEKIIYWLEKAQTVAETPEQEEVIKKLIEFYQTGSLKTFDDYAIAWVKD